jgi:3-oxoacyl-[acyl-carrier-protein] synthase III
MQSMRGSSEREAHMTEAVAACKEHAMRSGVLPARRELAMDNLTKKDQRDRSKINMHENFEVKYWTRELGVTREQLQKAVDKVGNSAATVRKELGK